MFSCLFNAFGCFDEVRKAIWKNPLHSNDHNNHTMMVESDEELEHHGLAANDFNARASEDLTSLQEDHEMVHDGMTDEEFAQLLQQQEYEQARNQTSSSTRANNRSSSATTGSGTMVDLGGFPTTTSLRDEQDEAYNRSLRMDQERQRQEELERQRQRDEELQRQREEDERERRIQDKLRLRREKAANLKQEPSETETSIAKVLIRMPDSSRITRRFRYSDTLGDIFDYLEVTKDMDMENYVIVTTFPARRFSIEEHANLTLTQTNLAEKQVTLNIAEK